MNSSWMKITGALLALVIHLYSSPSIGQIEEVVYYHNDALASPIVATDMQGAVKWREEYSPYGTRLLYESRESYCPGFDCYQVFSLEDEVQWFNGKYEAPSLGVLNYGARWYEPEMGRFLSADPVEFNENNVFSFNRFAYANNNPYRYTDPDGESPIDIVFFAVDVGVLAAAVYSGDSDAVQAAALDVAFSGIGVLLPIPGGGQALKAVRAADKIVDVSRRSSGVKSAVRSGESVASGGGKAPIIIGENMKRVREFADKAGGHAYRPWKNDSRRFGMERNERWIKDQIRGGRDIIDIGPDFKRRSAKGKPSPFYEVERRNLDGYKNYKGVFERSGNQGGVPGLDF